MFSFIYAWINDWVNNREAGDLRRQRGHYDVIVMVIAYVITSVYIIISPEITRFALYDDKILIFFCKASDASLTHIYQLWLWHG